MSTETIHLYAVGIAYASVCAPSAMPRDEVLAAANRAAHPGIGCGWQFSSNETFANGDPNPRACDQQSDTHLHYLLEC